MEKKEAMKILKDFHDKSALFSVRTALDTIIPELKESKDERIREMIIYQMERWHEAALENNAVQDIKDSADAITWLEKQGEQKQWVHVDPISEEDKLQMMFDGQKPADKEELRSLSQSEATSDSVTQTLVDAAKAFLQALSDTPYNNTPIVDAQIITKQLLTFLSDPKAYDPDASNEHKSAEWSEEDERMLNSTIWHLRHSVNNGDIEYSAGQLEDWLKSIKNRIQPKQEWSEEDEAMYQDVIETEQYMLDVVYGRKNFSVGNEDIKEECTKELAWLKSLKQRYMG